MRLNGENKKKSIVKYILLGGVLLAVGIFFLVSTLKEYDLKEVFRILESVEFLPMAIALLFALFSLSASGGSFFVVLNSLGGNLSYPRCFKYACAFLLFGNVTPAAIGSQPLTAVLIAKDKAKVTESVVAMFLHILIFKAWLIVFGIAAMMFAPHVIFSNPVLLIMFSWGMIFNLFYIVFCAMAIWAYKLLRGIGCKIIDFLYKIKLIRQKEKWLYRFTHMMEQYRESAVYVRKHPTVTLKMAGFIGLQRIFAFSIAYFSAKALGANVDYVSLFMTQIILTLAVESLPFPGGIGIAESVSVGLYAAVFAETALVVPTMVLNRGIGFYGMTLVCALVVLIGQVLSVLKHKRTNRD
ncbi:MAG: flippase-like domain-containing protein [Clostridia bacterium]|nr:flippase-like domain-containing protein [Clostridia bacterium]